MKQTDYLRDAKTHELISGVFGWIWIATTIAAVVWLFAAIFGSWSWWVVLGLFLVSGFLKSVTREYSKSAQKAIQDGVATGQIVISSTGQALPAGRDN